MMPTRTHSDKASPKTSATWLTSAILKAGLHSPCHVTGRDVMCCSEESLELLLETLWYDIEQWLMMNDAAQAWQLAA